MSRKTFQGSYLDLQFRTYYAVLSVPKTLRKLVGKTKYCKTTKTGDLKIAEQRAAAMVLAWKAEMRKLAFNSSDPMVEEALSLLNDTKDSPKHLVRELIQEKAEEIEASVGEFRATDFIKIATGEKSPLLAHVENWKEYELDRGLKQKTMDQMYSDISILTDCYGTTTSFDDDMLSLWLKNVVFQKELSPASLQRVMGSTRSFLRYLYQAEEIKSDFKHLFIIPEKFKRSKKANAKSANKIDSWIPLLPSDVVKLQKAAYESKDFQLSELILIGAYTGARIEEICSLKKENIDLESGSFRIIEAKTEAGNRIVPIHSSIHKLIESMLKASTDEYLFSKLGKNKYGQRANGLGKRFGRLKKDLNFDDRQVFHSIRKTVTTLLENAGVSENVTADLIGHDKPRITYGLYSGGTNLENKKIAIEKLNYPEPFMF